MMDDEDYFEEDYDSDVDGPEEQEWDYACDDEVPARTRKTCCLKMNATVRKTGRARRGKGMPQCVPTPVTWPPVLRQAL